MPSLAAGKEPVGTIEMKELQIAWVGSGNFSDGKLHFNGETYPFKISGLGVGGFGEGLALSLGADGIVIQMEE